MATLEFIYIPGRGQILAADAFDRVIGTGGFLTDKNRTVLGRCKILSVDVAPDGAYATWTVGVTEMAGPGGGPILLAWPGRRRWPPLGPRPAPPAPVT